jgi:hypothetical protein
MLRCLRIIGHIDFFNLFEGGGLKKVRMGGGGEGLINLPNVYLKKALKKRKSYD